VGWGWRFSVAEGNQREKREATGGQGETRCVIGWVKVMVALLGMLNCCASGISVVNIDKSFGAAVGAL
jgi:hypothetical protein